MGRVSFLRKTHRKERFKHRSVLCPRQAIFRNEGFGEGSEFGEGSMVMPVEMSLLECPEKVRLLWEIMV